MLGRHIRLAGVRLIETALSTKLADPSAIFNPTLPGVNHTPPGFRNVVPTASAAVPKIVTPPSSA